MLFKKKHYIRYQNFMFFFKYEKFAGRQAGLLGFKSNYYYVCGPSCAVTATAIVLATVFVRVPAPVTISVRALIGLFFK